MARRPVKGSPRRGGRNSVTVDDAALRALQKRVAEPSRVRVGVLASRGGNRRHPNADMTLIDLAIVHEFGAPKAGIPERSFLRRTFSLTGGRGAVWLPAFTARVAKAVVNGKLSMMAGMAVLGQKAVAEVRSTITTGSGVPPPLKPATIARKGSTRPLVDTGQLINSISYEIVDQNDPGILL